MQTSDGSLLQEQKKKKINKNQPKTKQIRRLLVSQTHE